MGYERNDRRYGGGYGDDRYRDRNFDRGQSAYRGTGYYGRADYGDYRGNRFDDRTETYGRDAYGARDYGRDPNGYDYQDRGFFDRAGDEVRSWFGDDDAERRRRADERHMAQQDPRYRDGGRFAPWGSGYTGPSFLSGGGYDNGGGYSPSDYGAGRGGGATSNWGLGAGNDRRDWGQDTGYHSWRSRQLEQFDRDYDEYRREHQQKFDTEFHGWRSNRQGQRDLLSKVQEHQEVVGSDGQHIGKVDHVRGDRIKLTKTDQSAGGHHHSIPSSWIVSVEDTVKVSKTADQAKAHWRDEDRNEGGLFSDRSDDRGANLNRSFSGTY